MAKKDKLEEIEGRFYSWTHLSDQQEEDITWIMNTLKEHNEVLERWRYAGVAGGTPLMNKTCEVLGYG